MANTDFQCTPDLSLAFHPSSKASSHKSSQCLFSELVEPGETLLLVAVEVGGIITHFSKGTFSDHFDCFEITQAQFRSSEPQIS